MLAYYFSVFHIIFLFFFFCHLQITFSCLVLIKMEVKQHAAIPHYLKCEILKFGTDHCLQPVIAFLTKTTSKNIFLLFNSDYNASIYAAIHRTWEVHLKFNKCILIITFRPIALQWCENSVVVCGKLTNASFFEPIKLVQWVHIYVCAYIQYK